MKTSEQIEFLRRIEKLSPIELFDLFMTGYNILCESNSDGQRSWEARMLKQNIRVRLTELEEV